jgi:hypothetical protein
LALDAAEKVNLAIPLANVVRDHFVQAMAQGYRDEDIAVLARVITNTSHAETRNLLEQPLNGVSMGRSSKEQADESRRRIVAEAGNLFRSRG